MKNRNPDSSLASSGRILAVAALLAVLGILAAAVPARAADAATGTGIGIVLGEPSGFSLKLPHGANSINVILGYDLDDGPDGPGCCDGDGHFYVGGDYVWYNYNLIRVSQGRFPLYYGPGAYVALWDRTVAGLRGVVGLEYQFATAPFDIFLEIGPRINVIPNTHTSAFGGLGTRFFF
jgi:hypothetical protein